MKWADIGEKMKPTQEELDRLYRALVAEDAELIDRELDECLTNELSRSTVWDRSAITRGYLCGVWAMVGFVLRTQPQLFGVINDLFIKAVVRHSSSSTAAQAKQLRSEQRQRICRTLATEFLDLEIDRYRRSGGPPPGMAPTVKTVARHVYERLVEAVDEDTDEGLVRIMTKVVHHDGGGQVVLSVTSGTIQRNYLSAAWLRDEWTRRTEKR